MLWHVYVVSCINDEYVVAIWLNLKMEVSAGTFFEVELASVKRQDFKLLGRHELTDTIKLANQHFVY